MRNRLLAAALLSCALGLSLGACDDPNPSPQPSSNFPSSSSPEPLPTDSPSEPPDSWKPSLKANASTFYFGQGTLPNPVLDKTKTTSAGRLTVRVECDRGKITVRVDIDGSTRTETVSCNGQGNIQNKFLDEVHRGQLLAIREEGEPGIRFALELVVEKSTALP